MSTEEHIEDRADLSALFPFQNIRIKHFHIPAVGAGYKQEMIVLNIEQLAEPRSRHGYFLRLALSSAAFAADEPFSDHRFNTHSMRSFQAAF